VNGGKLLQRWTNDYFLATPHRAVNRSGGERATPSPSSVFASGGAGYLNMNPLAWLY
jgi:hypothetical protein